MNTKKTVKQMQAHLVACGIAKPGTIVLTALALMARNGGCTRAQQSAAGIGPHFNKARQLQGLGLVTYTATKQPGAPMVYHIAPTAKALAIAATASKPKRKSNKAKAPVTKAPVPCAPSAAK